MNKLFTLKLIGLAFVLICTVSAIQAQDGSANPAANNGGFGIRVGGNISNQDFENGDLLDDPKSKFGLDLAVLYAIPLGGGTFMLQPELHWLQNGSVINDIQSNEEITSTLNYLELPVLLRWNFGGSLKVFALGGVSAGYLLGGKLEGGPEDDVKEIYNDLDFSGILGLGLGLGSIEFDIRYRAGLSDISESGGNYGKITNSSFGAGVSLVF